MLEIKRSPAKVCHHLLCNGILISTGTKGECTSQAEEYARKYGLTIKA